MTSLRAFSLQRPAHEYQSLMQSGQLSSEDLITSFLDQIDRHNADGLQLKAIVSVCPRNIALSQARRLDEERARGEVRSELHGVPIVIKVSRASAHIKWNVIIEQSELTIAFRMPLSRLLPWAWSPLQAHRLSRPLRPRGTHLSSRR